MHAWTMVLYHMATHIALLLPITIKCQDRTVRRLTQGLRHSRDHTAGALKRAAHMLSPRARSSLPGATSAELGLRAQNKE